MTRRFRFDRFIETLPPDGNSVTPDSSVYSEFEELVPEELTDFWRNYGFGSFGEQQLWFFDPRDILDEARKFEAADKGIPFARTAFADFFFIQSDAVYFTLVQPNRTARASPTTDIWGFNYFSSPEDTSAILKSDLHKEAESKLGPLERDECYGLKLALAQGGDEVVDNMRISKTVVYLDILATLHAD